MLHYNIDLFNFLCQKFPLKVLAQKKVQLSRRCKMHEVESRMAYYITGKLKDDPIGYNKYHVMKYFMLKL